MKKAERAAVMTAVLTSFAVTFMGSALNLSVPDMSREFGAKAGEIGWVVTIYMLAAAALAVPEWVCPARRAAGPGGAALLCGDGGGIPRPAL